MRTARPAPRSFASNCALLGQRTLSKKFNIQGSALRFLLVYPRFAVPSVNIAHPWQDFLRRLDGSAGFKPAVSPISNRQGPRANGSAIAHERAAGWKPCATALWKPELPLLP